MSEKSARGRFSFRKRRNFRAKSGGSSRTDLDSSNGQRSLDADVTCRSGPYDGWKLYHPNEEFKDDSETHRRVKATEAYIVKNKSCFTITLEKNYIEMDLVHLTNDEDFKSCWPSFDTDLTNEPSRSLDCLGLAAHQVFTASSKLFVRPINHQPVLPLANLKVNYFDKLVTIRGTVIRVGSPGLICKSMAFECLSCHSAQSLAQPQGVYTVPSACTSCKSSGKFEPLRSSPFTITIDHQVAKIQETHTQGVSGSIPKSIEVELYGELIGMASPGDLLSVTGIVRVHADTQSGENGKKGARLMQLYIEAVSVHNQRTLNHPTLTFTLKDYYAIQEVHGSDNVFRLLVQSLCPSIFGHEIVKAGLILGLMGGTESEGGSRPNPHILIVGDPGLGKSQLLQAATLIAPRGVYVCGNACTATGLTVSLSRSEGSGFTLEAGALVLADHGICCVDELDKMNASGHGALLEAMEQGSVSIARGGVVCHLAAAPTVLAAANPSQGHYNKAKTVCENLRMNTALLSRFDLVFILLDRPNEHVDLLLSKHVLALRSGEQSVVSNNTFNTTSNSLEFEINDRSLIERLKIQQNEDLQPLPPMLLRKYIAYSRKYVHPKLSQEAAKFLKEFYLKLRATYKSNCGGTPVTTRQLEACIRLTQARARINLREEATEEDAKDVVEIMKHSLIDTQSDESGLLNTSRSIHGSGISSKSKVKKLIAAITLKSKQLGKDIFHRSELIEIHKSYNIPGDPIMIIESLHVHGYLLLKGPNTYKLLTV